MTISPLARAFPRESAQNPNPVAQTEPDADARKSLVMRKFRIDSLTRGGAIYSTDQIGPATPMFESAFSAFARGTLIKTVDGPVAIEDLQPGMHLITREHGPMPLLWIGSMTWMPKPDTVGRLDARLTRIMADGADMARGSGDLIAGPGARLLVRPTDMHDIVGADHVLTPARDLVDGVHIIDIAPPRPVTLFHLCLHRHATITAAGIEAETFHPGRGFQSYLGQNMLSLFLSFFPHIHATSDFGPLSHPRVRANTDEAACL